jgi:hypothetical protein
MVKSSAPVTVSGQVAHGEEIACGGAEQTKAAGEFELPIARSEQAPATNRQDQQEQQTDMDAIAGKHDFGRRQTRGRKPLGRYVEENQDGLGQQQDKDGLVGVLLDRNGAGHQHSSVMGLAGRAKARSRSQI